MGIRRHVNGALTMMALAKYTVWGRCTGQSLEHRCSNILDQRDSFKCIRITRCVKESPCCRTHSHGSHSKATTRPFHLSPLWSTRVRLPRSDFKQHLAKAFLFFKISLPLVTRSAFVHRVCPLDNVQRVG